MIVPARHRLPRAINYRGGVWSGMGATPPQEPVYKKVVGGTAIPGPNECYITDTACVMGNTRLGDAYQAALLEYSAQTAFDECLKSTAYATSQAQYNDAVARCQAQYVAMYSELGGADSVPSNVPGATPYVQSAPATSASTPVAPPTAAPSATPAKTVVTSSGAQTAPPSTPVALTTAAATSSASVLGFDLSSIPWWGWLAAGGAAFFFMGGQRGR